MQLKASLPAPAVTLWAFVLSDAAASAALGTAFHQSDHSREAPAMPSAMTVKVRQTLPSGNPIPSSDQQRSRAAMEQKLHTGSADQRQCTDASAVLSSAASKAKERGPTPADPAPPKAASSVKRPTAIPHVGSGSSMASASGTGDRVVSGGPAGQSSAFSVVGSMVNGVSSLVQGTQKGMEAGSVGREGLGAMEKVLPYPNGQLFPDQGAVSAVHPVVMADREQLTFDMNNFDEEEVYIRRSNKSSASLEGSGAGEPSAYAEAPEVAEVPSSAPQDVKEVTGKQDWRHMNGCTSGASPTPRLNFQFANGLLYGAPDKIAECHGSRPMEDTPVGFSSPTVHRETSADMDPPGLGLEQEASHSHHLGINSRSATGFPTTRQPPVMASNPMSANNAATPLPRTVEAKAPKSATRGLEVPDAPTREKRSKVDAAGPFRGPMPCNGIPPPTNDLDRLLLQATPMLEVDPNKRVEKALEDLKLVGDVFHLNFLFTVLHQFQGTRCGPFLQKRHRDLITLQECA